MRAFVTGGTGFVGGWLRSHLEDCGDEVTAVGEEVDITDAKAVRASILEARPDAVYHLAGQAHVGDSWDDPIVTFRVNTLGTLHVLEAARRCEPVPTVVLVSSAEVYGVVAAVDLPVRESRELRPVTPYAASKAAAEDLGLQSWLGYGVPVVRARAFNHAGPGQGPSFLVSALCRRIVEAERRGDGEIAVGNLSPERDFTDVRDVVRAYRLLVERGTPGEVYNVCSGRAVGVREVAERLVKLAGGRLSLVEDADLVRPVEVPVLVGDRGRIGAATGWEPAIALDTTLADSLAWWRTHLVPETR
jgi:GDP-4-dehydro-6-deoxy-D-mannose reductase